MRRQASTSSDHGPSAKVVRLAKDKLGRAAVASLGLDKATNSAKLAGAAARRPGLSQGFPTSPERSRCLTVSGLSLLGRQSSLDRNKQKRVIISRQ